MEWPSSEPGLVHIFFRPIAASKDNDPHQSAVEVTEANQLPICLTLLPSAIGVIISTFSNDS